MSTKRLSFPKTVITRCPEADFSDDGTRFRMYKYKDKISFSVARLSDEIFISLRVVDGRYLKPDGYDMSHYPKVNCDRFNGVHIDRFNLDAFLQDCENAYNYTVLWRSKAETKKRLEIKLEIQKQNLEYVQNSIAELTKAIAELEN